MRALVKRLLRKYGYPPDLQDAAVHKRPAINAERGRSWRIRNSIVLGRLLGVKATRVGFLGLMRGSVDAS